jgi:hypothetical protein
MDSLKNEGKDDKKNSRKSKDADNSSLPPLYGMRKSINSSPKRKIITLKLPKVEINPKDTHFKGFHRSTPNEKPETSRYLSISVESKKNHLNEYQIHTPAKSSLNNYQNHSEDFSHNPNHSQKPSISQINASKKTKIQKINKFSRKFWKTLPESCPSNEISIKGESKLLKVQFTQSSSTDNSLFSVTKAFKDHVESKYLELFNEIDLSRNGNFNLDDVINYLILLGINKPVDQESSYLDIRRKAQSIFQVFFMVSLKVKIPKKDFFAVCSVYENLDEGKNEFLLEVDVFERVKQQVMELKDVFNCYAKDGFVDQKEMKSILACVQAENIHLIEELVCKEAVNFSRFLRYLPVFLWMHQEVVRQLEISKSV